MTFLVNVKVIAKYDSSQCFIVKKNKLQNGHTSNSELDNKHIPVNVRLSEGI